MHAPAPHDEHHFKSSQTVSDIVIGMADGLTVPFALAAGLSGAIDHNTLIITAGLAEIIAGSIAMGLGGYLAARTQAEHYDSEYRREWEECEQLPDREREEVAIVFREYGLPEAMVNDIVGVISADRTRWVDFMMKFELGLEKPAMSRAPISAATIAGAYIVGGLIPLLPYMIFMDTHEALKFSAGFTLLALAVFGWLKGKFTGLSPLKSSVQTTLIGGLAAAAAFGLTSLFQ